MSFRYRTCEAMPHRQYSRRLRFLNITHRVSIFWYNAKVMKKNTSFVLLVWTLTAISSCGLFNNMPEANLEKKMDETIAWAKAPWVPLYIETGGLGTASLMASQTQTVKLGYSFTLAFQPNSNYLFQGWQAWVADEGYWAAWKGDGNEYGTELVKFKALDVNHSGAEVEIFVYKMPPEGKSLYIGPFGANADELNVAMEVSPSEGTTIPQAGRINPNPKLELWFTVNYTPTADYQFVEWQALDISGNTVGEDAVVFESKDSLQTRVMVKTTSPLRLQPKAEERPYIKAANVRFGESVAKNQSVKIQFSRQMNPDSFNWDTVSIEGRGGPSGSITYGDDDFEMISANDNTVLILKPIMKGVDEYVDPDSTITITLRRLKLNGDPGVCSQDGISLARNLIVEYETIDEIALESDELLFDIAKLAYQNDGQLVILDDDAFLPLNYGELYIVFTLDPLGLQNPVQIKVTESCTVPADYPGIGGSGDTTITLSTAEHLKPDLAGQFSGRVPYVVPITMITEAPVYYYLGRDPNYRLNFRLVISNVMKDSAPKYINSRYRIPGFASAASSYLEMIPVAGARVRTSISSYSFFIDEVPYSQSNIGAFQANRDLNIYNFQLGQYKVTEAFWKEVRAWAEDHGYRFATNSFDNGTNNGDDSPIGNVSWLGMVVWCNALSEMCGLPQVYKYQPTFSEPPPVVKNTSTRPVANYCNFNGGGYRLPFEAEWEYAARGGKINPSANWNTRDISSPSLLNLYNMGTGTGSTREEFCWDNYAADTSSTPITGPSSSSFGDYIVSRGARIDSRTSQLRDRSNDTYGFRLARTN